MSYPLYVLALTGGNRIFLFSLNEEYLFYFIVFNGVYDIKK